VIDHALLVCRLVIHVLGILYGFEIVGQAPPFHVSITACSVGFLDYNGAAGTLLLSLSVDYPFVGVARSDPHAISL